MILVYGSLEQALKKLRKGFERDILPIVKDHRWAVSPGQRRRRKHVRALKKARKRALAAARRAAEKDSK
jgi:ribosomal protein S21